MRPGKTRGMIWQALLAVGAAIILSGRAGASDWPGWRGPDRNDITAEDSGWSAGKWPPGSPVWTKNVGNGCSSPVVAGGRLYVMGNSGGKDYVYCLDAATGNEIWKKSYDCPEYGRRSTGDKGQYKGPSSTPEYDPATGCLYTLSIDGDLNCWDTNNSGQRKWGFDLYDAYGVSRRPNVGRGVRDYGYTSSPLVYGSWLIVEVGDNEGNLMAFDKSTGVRRWTSRNKDPAGHNGGPVPITVQGVPCVAVLTIHRLLVVRLDRGHEGETVATYGWETDYANNIPTPTVSGNKVVLTSGYNIKQTVMLNVTLGGITPVWMKPGKYSRVCSPIIYNNHVYLASGKVKCFDGSGNVKWEGGSFRDDCSLVLTADKRLIVFGKGVKLALVDTADLSSSYKERASKTTGAGGAGGRSWPHVVLADGLVYCKNRFGKMECYDLGGSRR